MSAWGAEEWLPGDLRSVEPKAPPRALSAVLLGQTPGWWEPQPACYVSQVTLRHTEV